MTNQVIRLLVKGSKAEAFDAAAKRNIAVEFIGHPTNPETGEERANEVLLNASVEHETAVLSWYSESDHAPFPGGSLLLYRTIKLPIVD